VKRILVVLSLVLSGCLHVPIVRCLWVEPCVKDSAAGSTFTWDANVLLFLGGWPNDWNEPPAPSTYGSPYLLSPKTARPATCFKEHGGQPGVHCWDAQGRDLWCSWRFASECHYWPSSAP
jgi:hypothetical protein